MPQSQMPFVDYRDQWGEYFRGFPLGFNKGNFEKPCVPFTFAIIQSFPRNYSTSKYQRDSLSPGGDRFGQMSCLTVQLEYYFSIENLSKDIYLRNQMNAEGFVDLRIIGEFEKIKQLTTDMDDIRQVCQRSRSIEYIRIDGIEGSEELVRRKVGWEKWLLDPSPPDIPEVNELFEPVHTAIPIHRSDTPIERENEMDRPTLSSAIMHTEAMSSQRQCESEIHVSKEFIGKETQPSRNFGSMATSIAAQTVSTEPNNERSMELENDPSSEALPITFSSIESAHRLLSWRQQQCMPGIAAMKKSERVTQKKFSIDREPTEVNEMMERLMEVVITQRMETLLQEIVHYALPNLALRQHANDAPQRQSARPTSNGGSSTSSTLGSSSKRTRSEENTDHILRGDENESDDEENGPRRTSNNIITTAINRRLKCPWYQREPDKYQSNACKGMGFTDMAKLKDHIKRVHTQPLRCARCKEEMTDDDALTHHLNAKTICTIAPEPSDDRMSLGFMKKLNFKKEPYTQAKSPEEKWRRLYSVLFPKDKAMPSPYECHGITTRMERVLTEALVEELSKELASSRIVEKIKSRIPAIIEKCRMQLMEPYDNDYDRNEQSNLLSRFSSTESSEKVMTDFDFSEDYTETTLEPMAFSGLERQNMAQKYRDIQTHPPKKAKCSRQELPSTPLTPCMTPGTISPNERVNQYLAGTNNISGCEVNHSSLPHSLNGPECSSCMDWPERVYTPAGFRRFQTQNPELFGSQENPTINFEKYV